MSIVVRITREQNTIVRNLLISSADAHKNWIASAVERNDHEDARKLVVELRKIQDLMCKFVPDDMVVEG